MLKLKTKLVIDNEFIQSPNLADRFCEEDLVTIGDRVWEGYAQDEASRSAWRRRTEAATDLALQVVKEKTFPWPNCSNVAFPLVTIAALQFHSRAYPILVQNPDLVRYRVVGGDETGERTTRALRIGAHMSYQLLDESSSWEEHHDRLMLSIPIVGCAFKKTYFDGATRENSSDLVLASDLVMDYYAKSVESCARKTHVVRYYRNEIYESVMSGIFCDVLEDAWYQQPAAPMPKPNEPAASNRLGQTQTQPDENTPFTLLEQHCFFDFDGDGYGEPYIVTIEATSRKVFRIVARFDREDDVARDAAGKIIKITPTEYFTKYSFIPSPDGGVYDLGFGVLLGPLNESVNALVNQLVDSGTMANTAGGFLGRGAKIRGGVYTFAPLEWKRVDSSVDDLTKSIYPLPVREPSAVLFQLLSLLISYTGRIAGTTETMVGENPGQNTPASTTDAMIEQGSKIYAAIFKRVWRSMKEEFRKLYILNAIYLPNMVKYCGEGGTVTQQDYLDDPRCITPVADPNVTSERLRFMQVSAIKQAAATTPGYNIGEVERRYLRALRADSISTIYPGPENMPQGKDTKLAIEELKLQSKQAALEQERMLFVLDLTETQRLNTAKIAELEAKAAKHYEQAEGVRSGQAIAAYTASIGAMKTHNDGLLKQIETILKAIEGDRADARQTVDAGNAGRVEPAPGDTKPPQILAPAQAGFAGSLGGGGF